ncbi:MAG: hypothetical protein ACOCZK_00155 [Planctomycetota bacterium]
MSRGTSPGSALAFVLVLVLFLGLAALLRAGEEADQAAFDRTAAELTAAQETRRERIQAIHRFVRDEITEIPTEYG